jgi:farnesyl-diphosphate farnesyltransferase
VSRPGTIHPALRYLLSDLLRGVSRSFYLTLRVLPKAIRPQIGIAYLLARATDTIADTELVPVEGRLKALESLRARILGTTREPLDFGAMALKQATASEKILLQRITDVLAAYELLEEPDREHVQKVLTPITRGQELDLARFSGASTEKPTALSTFGELDEYTYLVAGCVGEFWTKICLAHLSPLPSADPAVLLGDSIRFGKGLQLVNVLRDLPADLRKGRCYIPSEFLKSERLTPADLLNPTKESRFRVIYNPLLEIAEGHLTAGWRYTCALPRSWRRVRLACAWPILIGLATLQKLKTETVLNPDKRVKISRGAVRRMMVCSILALPFKNQWEKLVKKQPSGPTFA